MGREVTSLCCCVGVNERLREKAGRLLSGNGKGQPWSPGRGDGAWAGLVTLEKQRDDGHREYLGGGASTTC